MVEKSVLIRKGEWSLEKDKYWLPRTLTNEVLDRGEITEEQLKGVLKGLLLTNKKPSVINKPS